jgi:hypothetical protein
MRLLDYNRFLHNLLNDNYFLLCDGRQLFLYWFLYRFLCWLFRHFRLALRGRRGLFGLHSRQSRRTRPLRRRRRSG